LIDIAKRFRTIMRNASSRLAERGHRRIGANARQDGFDAAACVIRRARLSVATAGIPVFVLSSNGRVKLVGSYNSLKQLTAERETLKNITRVRKILGDNRFVVFASDGIVKQRDDRKREFGIDAVKR